jgi:phosphoribosyl-AMP cyclohydrolase
MPNFAKRNGLITVVTQDVTTKEVLMVAFTDKAGFLESLKTGEAVYYSTSRKKRWKKGETSGNIQILHGIRIDCDGDAVIYFVTQKGDGACHEGKRSCFYRSVVGSTLFTNPKTKVIEVLEVCEKIANGWI